MEFVNVCSRLNNKACQRFRLNNVKMDGPVSALREMLVSHSELNSDNVEILYAGRKLKNTDKLSDYGIKSGVTIHVLERPEKRTVNSVASVEPVSEAFLEGIVASPFYKTVVEKIFSNSDSVDELLSAVPELESDHVALSFLLESDLVEMIGEQNSINKLLLKHPYLKKALAYVGKLVTEKSADAPPQSQRLQYSMDQMSDDDMDSSNLQQVAPQPITAGQLGAALASLSGSTQQSSSASNSQPVGITHDLLRHAMAASGSQSDNVQGRPVSESDLQQLREMGITDERVARQALEATGGNIQAALELIFDDGF